MTSSSSGSRVRPYLVTSADAARLPRWMWWGLSAGSLGGIAFVIWFLSVSIMTFGKLCPFCMVIWSVTIPVAAHSWAWAAASSTACSSAAC